FHALVLRSANAASETAHCPSTAVQAIHCLECGRHGSVVQICVQRGDHATARKSSTLFRWLTATPSSRSRAICLRPTEPRLVELTTPFAATTRNQGSCSDSSTVSLARTKAT